MTRRKVRLNPFFWGGLIFVLGQVFTFLLAFRQKSFIEENQITPPQAPLGLAVGYFFGAVVILGIVLFLIPVSILKLILKAMFAFLFAWGLFIILAVNFALPYAFIFPIIVGLIWFFQPRIWLHDLLLLLALVSLSSTFGFVFSPWIFLTFMFVIAVYDFLAVRFGYMQWMAGKMSDTGTLPAFIIPSDISGWNLDIRTVDFQELKDKSSSEREFSVLGGGDIGFPLIMVISIFFAEGFADSLIVSVSALTGLFSAYLIQRLFLKGKPVPALPPIFFFSLIGFLIAHFT